ncbi:MAG: hypothetical protein R3F21_13045 [Myxococcota bacterium]
MSKGRDLDAADEVEPAHRLDLLLCGCQDLRIDGDVGVVRKDRPMWRARASSRSATSRSRKRTGSCTPWIENGTDHGVAAFEEQFEIREVSRGRSVLPSRPMLDAVGVHRRQLAIGLGVGADADHPWRASLSILSTRQSCRRKTDVGARALWTTWRTSTLIRLEDRPHRQIVSAGTESPGFGLACSTLPNREALRAPSARGRYSGTFPANASVWQRRSERLEEPAHRDAERGGGCTSWTSKRRSCRGIWEIRLTERPVRLASGEGQADFVAAAADPHPDLAVQTGFEVDDQTAIANPLAFTDGEDLLELDQLLEEVEGLVLHGLDGELDRRRAAGRDHAEIGRSREARPALRGRRCQAIRRG